MNVQVFPRRRVFSCRLFVPLIALALLCAALAAPSLVLAAEPGETDPAKGFSEWPDDEFFVAQPELAPGGASRFSIFEYNSDGKTLEEEDGIDYTGKNILDVVAVTAGRFLVNTHDSVLYAYRDDETTAGFLNFYRPPTLNTYKKVASLIDLAPRVAGSADFIDLASGDLDGELDANGEYRDEAVVAWAQKSADNKLPVSISVLAFGGATEASPLPTTPTTAVAPGELDAAAIIAGDIKPVDNALALAVGDFNGDGVKEIAVAYLTSPTTLNIDIYQYSVALVNHVLQRSLTRVGGTTVTLANNYKWNESLTLAAGDFDGAVDPSTGVRRDELALGTSERVILSPTSHQQDVRMRLFRFTCTDGVGCTTNPNLTVTPAGPYDLPDALTDDGTGPARKVQLAAGLFKVDPVNGWDFNRRQLVAAYSIGSPGDLGPRVRTIEVQSNLSLALSNPTDYYGFQRFWLAAGGFEDSRSSSNPLWSIALTMWGGTTYRLEMLQPAPALNRPVFWARTTSTTAIVAPNGARMPVVAVDTDGDSMALGAPVHMVIYDVVNLDFMLQEPPKHAYWDPDLAQVFSVSRTDDFNITLVSSEGTSFTSKSTDSSDWSIGGSVSASAKGTVGASTSVIIAKASTEASVEVSGKVAYDYQQHESDYNEGKQERTVTFSGATNKDDYLVGRLQTLHIWRYRIFGMDLDGPAQSPFFEIVIPGSARDLETDAGGLNFDWYQPTHENGNILSYPAFVEGQTFNPPDLGSYTIPCEPGTPGCVEGKKTVTELLLKPAIQYCDGNTGARALTFSSESGGGAERSSSHKLAENAAIKGTYKTSASVGGKRNNVSTSLELSAEAEFHNSNSWGSSSSSNFKTTSGTGITLNRKGCSSITAYAYFPVLYQTTDGTIKATFAVDPLQGEWWRDHYGQQPDLALNLPWRFYFSTVSQWNTGNWMPTSSAGRKHMRGFFVRRNTPNPATGIYDQYPGAVLDGETARLEARIYNYSVTQSVPADAKARFDVVPYDWSTNQETGDRVTIGTATLPALAPRQMVTTTIAWDTTGMSGANSQMYRVYVVLDPENKVTEKYETESKATQFYFTVDLTHPAGGFWTTCADLSDTEYQTRNCIDPAQNNEGYGYVTVAKQPLAAVPGQRLEADVSMDEGGLAALDADGNVMTDTVQAMAGQPLQIRVTVHTDTPGTEFSNVLVFDGDPEQGGVLIAGKKIFVGSIAPEGNSVWFEWAPSTPGQHTLYAVVTETNGDSQPGNNTDTLDVLVASPGWRSLFPIIFK